MPLLYHDKQHIARMIIQEQRINALFLQFINSISPELKRWKDVGRKDVWVSNKAIEKQIDVHLKQLQDQLLKLIESGANDSWNFAHEKNDKFIKAYIKGMALPKVVEKGMFIRNAEAFQAYFNRIEDGMTFSDRVTNNVIEGAKEQIQFYLKSGISAGRSADVISRDIRQLLKDPDKRFHRIKNDAGKLIESAPMKNYHPGHGVYKSAYKNAVRIAATETNLAYRLADSERWKRNESVLGFEVKRSKNGLPCVVCDSLKGKYPKGFVFPGWHPFCICLAVPIMMTTEESARYYAEKYSSDYTGGKVNPTYVTDIPTHAQTFLDKNPTYAQKSYVSKYNDLKKQA